MASLKFLEQIREIAGPIGDVTLSTATAADESAPSLLLSSYKGKVLVLLVLGVTCKTCRHVAAVLSNVLSQLSIEAAGVGICVQSGCGDRLDYFASGAEIHLPLTSCRLRDLCPALGISSSTWLFYPTLIFIDREQRLRGLFISGDTFFENLETNLRVALDQLVTEAPAELPVEAMQ